MLSKGNYMKEKKNVIFLAYEVKISEFFIKNTKLKTKIQININIIKYYSCSNKKYLKYDFPSSQEARRQYQSKLF